MSYKRQNASRVVRRLLDLAQDSQKAIAFSENFQGVYDDSTSAIIGDSGVFAYGGTNATVAALVADGGGLSLTCAADSANDVYIKKPLIYNLDNAPAVEAVIDISVALANANVFVGLLDTNGISGADISGIGAIFKIDASLNLYIATDDNVTDSGLVDTGYDVTIGTKVRLGIDLSDKSNVKFYKDGKRLKIDTRFSMVGATADTLVQPIIYQVNTAGSAAGQTDVYSFLGGAEL